MRNLFFLILFLSHTGFAQESIIRLWNKGNQVTKFSSEEALVIYQQAFNEAVKQKNLLWQANICVDQCGAFYDKGDFTEAINRCTFGLNLMSKNSIKNDSIQFKLHSAIAACYNAVYNLNESFRQFELANIILHKHQELENLIPMYVTFHFVNQGSIWYTLSDFERAILYYEKALSIGKNLPSKSSYAIILSRLSSIYKYKKDYNRSIKIIEEAISYYNINGKVIEDSPLAEMYYSLAECYSQIGNNIYSNLYIDKSRRVSIKNLPNIKAKHLIYQIDLFKASMLLKSREEIKSKALYLAILQKNYRNKFYNLNMNYQALKGLSEVEYNLKNYKKALYYSQRALSEIADEKIEDEFSNPTDISSMFTAIGVFVVLNKKVEILQSLYYKEKKIKYLEAAFQTQKLSVELAKKMRQSHESIDSKILFSDFYYNRYEKLIELCFEFYEKTKSKDYLKTAFNILDESKSIILSDNLTLQNSYRNSGSDSLIVKLKANQAYVAYLKGSDKENIENIKTYELRVNQILEKLSVINKSYVESFKSENNSNLDLFRKKLDKKSLYLNYSIIRNYLYVTLTKKNKIDLRKIPINPEEFVLNKNLLKTALTSNPGPYSGFKARKSAAYFYDILIRPFEADLKGIDNLIINPDNEMIELSFDILVPHEKSNDYLIKKYNISYLNSALNYNDKIKNKFSRADQNWLSFAPFGSKTKNSNDINIQNLTILPSTIKEINGIKGQSIINEKSTKQTFVKTISELKDRVILIATHASENNGEPYLNFFPANDNYRLYANEIQYLDFKTPLVILGACESNAGKKMKGSGVLSIAKAFSIGGCPSVVGSLWEVHDESMAVLVSLFYKHLMRGERKDVALRLAKLEYLETETGLRNDPPYYWAHLQIIGDVSPLIIWPVILRYVMYGLMVVILSVSIVYGIRSRKRFFN